MQTLAAKPFIVPSFLRSSVGRGFLIFAFCCGLMSVAVGVGIYNLSLYWFAADKGEEKVTAEQLVDAFVSVYSETRGEFMTQDAPVPSRFRALGVSKFNQMRNSDNALRLRWVGTPGREIIVKASDAHTIATIEGFTHQAKPEPVSQYVTVDNALLFRTVYPVIAKQQACVDCHNDIQASWIAAGRPTWRLNDVMGAAVLDVPMDSFLRQSRIVSTLVGLAVLLFSTGIGLVTFYLQYKEFCRRARSEASLTKTEEQLRQSQKIEAVGQLTGGIAHDFNNLLGVSIGNLDLLREKTTDNPQLQALIDTALNANLRGAELTGRLLAFARKQPLRPEIIDVYKCLTNFAEMLRSTLGETIVTTMVPSPGLWHAMADPAQLETAMLNLAINARDAMPKGGRLIFEATNIELDEAYHKDHAEAVPGDYVMLAVTDTGIGMAPEVVKRVFEPFFTTKPQGQGTGLGLSMVYGFVKQSGGYVNIYSEPGHGTTVRICLPRAKENMATRPVSPKREVERLPTGSENVLLVEDNQPLRETAARTLAELGYRVVEAEDGNKALNIINSGVPIDLLLTDIVMPGGMNGYELAAKARQNHPLLRVLFTSGYAEASLRAAANGWDGSVPPGILSKPYRKNQLARELRSVLDGA